MKCPGCNQENHAAWYERGGGAVCYNCHRASVGQHHSHATTVEQARIERLERRVRTLEMQNLRLTAWCEGLMMRFNEKLPAMLRMTSPPEPPCTS